MFDICIFWQQPGIILLKEGTDSSQGVPQLISNINACQFIADAVRTTLGPRGMDKLIVNSQGKLVYSTRKYLVQIRVFDGQEDLKLNFFVLDLY